MLKIILLKKVWQTNTYWQTKNIYVKYLCKGTFTFEVITIKNNISLLRKNLNITQEELANALSVSRQTIISIENGKYNPSLVLAFEISRYFDLSIEEIFKEED